MLKTVFHHVENFTTSDLRPAGWGSGEHHRLSVVAATGLRERGALPIESEKRRGLILLLGLDYVNLQTICKRKI